MQEDISDRKDRQSGRVGSQRAGRTDERNGEEGDEREAGTCKRGRMMTRDKKKREGVDRNEEGKIKIHCEKQAPWRNLG